MTKPVLNTDRFYTSTVHRCTYPQSETRITTTCHNVHYTPTGVSLVTAAQQLDEALCYKPEDRGLTYNAVTAFLNSPHSSSRPEANSASNRNECWESSSRRGVKDGRRVRLTATPSSVSRLFRIMWEPRRLTTLWASLACYRDSFTIFKVRKDINELSHSLTDFLRIYYIGILRLKLHRGYDQR
jgi:hypothetical protein